MVGLLWDTSPAMKLGHGSSHTQRRPVISSHHCSASRPDTVRTLLVRRPWKWQLGRLRYRCRLGRLAEDHSIHQWNPRPVPSTPEWCWTDYAARLKRPDPSSSVMLPSDRQIILSEI